MSPYLNNIIYFTSGILFAILFNMLVKSFLKDLEMATKKDNAEKIKKKFNYLFISDTLH